MYGLYKYIQFGRDLMRQAWKLLEWLQAYTFTLNINVLIDMYSRSFVVSTRDENILMYRPYQGLTDWCQQIHEDRTELNTR